MSAFAPAAMNRFHQTPFVLSWKSRLGRDPELRQKKLEKLNKRYTLRRFDELDDVLDVPTGVPHASEITPVIHSTLDKLSSDLERIVGPSTLAKDMICDTKVGGASLRQLATTTMNSPYTATIVPYDRGNLDMVFKAVRIHFPTCTATILGRDRIELRLKELTSKEVESRESEIANLISNAEKQLKKLE